MRFRKGSRAQICRTAATVAASTSIYYACSVRLARFGICICAAVPAWSAPAAVLIQPSDIRLQSPGESQRIVLSGGSGCETSSTDPRVAAVEGNRVVAHAPGQARIDVRCADGSAATTVQVGNRRSAMGVGFERDLLSILTTKGCNSSACHGSPAGQNGFRLSLYGSDPRFDYDMIVNQHAGRRISAESPEDSLLLAKPSFAIAHGGGQLMTPASDEYATILEWLRQGTPYGAGGTRLERLEIHPGEQVLTGAGQRQPVVVVGRLSDGSTRDLTAEVRYAVKDEAVVTLEDDWTVTAKAPGMTTVMARAMGKAAAAQFIVVEESPSRGLRFPDPANFIDEHVFDKLRDVGVEPFPLSDDRTFLRRVYLDTVGVLPTAGEAEAFLASDRPDKRSALVDRLLDSEEYSTQWLVKFEDWFRNSQYYSQGRTNGSFKRWLHDSIREDWPYDEMVRAMLTAEGDTTVRPAGNFWHPAIDFMLKKFEVEKAVPTITRLFLGQRLECAQCHNHPLENLTQDDFYGLAAFLARTRVKHGYGQYRRIWYDDRRGEIEHPVTKQSVKPRFLGGEQPEIPTGTSRREVLADWVTRTEQTQFARATVNRVWYEYFQRGIVEPFDDFRSTNRATHPALLDDLARYFIDSGFRFKALHRLILNSKTYQLSAHVPGRPGGERPLEDALFARYLPRKLPAEVLLDAISRVTGVAEEFNNYPAGTSPKELIASIGATHFLTTFGHPRRDIMEARSNAPSLAQALQMMNGDVLAGRMEAEGFVLDTLLRQGLSDGAIIDTLYGRAFSRTPEAAEREALEAYLAAESAAGRDRRQGLANMLWAILNTKEFQMNL
ncbi:MAG: DUF1553 domain-containing protein [Acidobacteriia bacterium]|nr:DUF1553 domain-containing protein [Terriglobia bacterium]